MTFFAVIFVSTSCEKEKAFEPKQLKVLVMGSVSNVNYLVDVKNKIDSTNLFVQVDTFNIYKQVPTTDLLNQYNAVFVFTDNGALDSEATGNALAEYIEAGGGVVNAVFSGNVTLIGNFTNYAIITASGQKSGIVRTLGSVTDTQHTIMKNILNFNGGQSSYNNIITGIDEGAVILAKYDNDDPFIIIKENVGPQNAKRVFLNFYPPSRDVRDDFWDTTTDGALIMGYSLSWVAK